MVFLRSAQKDCSLFEREDAFGREEELDEAIRQEA